MKLQLLSFFILFSLSVSAQFTAPQFIHTDTPFPIRSLAHADFDNDGLLDMVFGFDSHLSWSKNLGNDKWSTNVLIENFILEFRDIEVVDLDEDGLMDIIEIGRNDETTSMMYINWFRNEGNFKFSPAISIDSFPCGINNTLGTSIEISDFNNDGHQDILAVASSNFELTNRLLLYINDGQGNLNNGIGLTDATANNPRGIQLADINLDGFIDILQLNSYSEFVLIENDNGNGFNTPEFLFTPFLTNEFLGFALIDIDGNGTKDICVGSDGGVGVKWYSQTSAGVFDDSPQSLFGLQYSVTHIIPADIDNDGDLDIVFSSHAFNDMGYIENIDGLGNYEDPVIVWTSLVYASDGILSVVDLDNDNDLDIVFSGKDQLEYSTFENTDGQGNFVLDQSFAMSTPASYGGEQEHFGDIDGDGFQDIVISGDFLTWLRFNPDFNIYEQAQFFETASDATKMDLIDINNDGVQDIIYTESGSSNNTLYWHLNDGSGNFLSANTLTYPSVNYKTKIFTEDINGDGWEDLILASGSFSGDGIFLYKNQGIANGGFEPVETLGTTSTNFLVFADIDEDGLTDIFPLLNNTPDLGWIKNNGTSFEPWTMIVDNNVWHDDLIFDDFDNDGLKDILLFQYSTFSFYKNLGNLIFNPPVEISNTINYHSIYLIDFDLDGFKDLVYREDDENLFWQKNTNDANLVGSPQVIDGGLERYVHLYFHDLDNDTDLDMIYKDYNSLYTKINISANGQIIAKAFYDENNNGDFDTDEPTLNHFQFSLTPDETIYYATNNEENFFFVNEGNYILNSIPMTGWDLTTGEANCAIDFIQDTVINKMFGYYPATLSASISPNLSSAPTRCGFDVPFWLTYENDGTTIENGLIELYVEDHATFISATPAPDSISNDTLFWHINSLAPTHQSVIKLDYQIFDASFLGDSVRITANTYIADPNNTFTLSQTFNFASEIACAYDPNDKQVIPAGLLDEHYTLMGKELEYTIRFQNTGTDTAFNITITDVLDSDLDLSSFQVITSSHLMETSLNEQNRTLNFYFPNILLPDSIVNEPLSHGFIKYKISPQTNLPEGTRIENEANIFFDFNPPILTNTTLNTLVNSFDITTTVVTNDPLCNGNADGSIELTVSAIPPIMYTWNDPLLTGASLANLNAGTYSVTITDGLNQTDLHTYNLDEPPLISGVLTMMPQVDMTLGSTNIEPAGGTPPYSITWNTSPTQTGNTANNLEAGTYSVTVVDSNNCTFTDSIEVTFTTSVSNIKEEFQFSVFPNPTRDNITIQYNNTITNQSELQIIDLTGKIIFSKKINPSNRLEEIQLQDFVAKTGIYWIGIRVKEQFVFQKLVVLP